MNRNYRDLKIWRAADDVAFDVYKLSQRFPQEEQFGLTAQLRRAITSVPANIVEGSARETKKEYLHFLTIAKGSLAEAEYWLHFAHRMEYLEKDEHLHFSTRIDKLKALLFAFIRGIREKY